ncbi:MAG: IS66 family transposase [Maricaulaceae bacterium]
MISTTDLPDDTEKLKAIILVQQEQNARLEALVAAFKQAMFGYKSEKINADQLEFALEDIETQAALVEAEGEADKMPAPRRANKRNNNLGSLPKHLPRIEEIIEPDNTTCACGTDRHIIGEDVTERLDVIPASFRVIKTRRPKYACRSCEDGIVQAPAKPHIITGGLPTEATIASVIVSKYADHLPLYRQSQIFARQNVHIDRSTLAGWVGRAAFELQPVYLALMADLKTSTKLFMDETTAPVQEPGRGKVKKGYFWALARNDGPWGGGSPPGVAFTYAPGRSGQHAEDILKGFTGVLQVDGYAGYNRLLDPKRLQMGGKPIVLTYCWAHARRKLHELTLHNTAPLAKNGLKQIASCYKIEADIRGMSATERLEQRQQKTQPLMEAFKLWLDQARSQVSAKSPTGAALKYIARYWDGLILFLEDGRIEMDNNTVERTIRPIALGRKNALFAGHEAGAQNWAMLASLIETCKLNSINPHAYLSDSLTAIAQGHKQSQIDQLLPWNFKTRVLCEV